MKMSLLCAKWAWWYFGLWVWSEWSVCVYVRIWICPIISSNGRRGNMNAPEQEECYLETNTLWIVRCLCVYVAFWKTDVHTLSSFCVYTVVWLYIHSFREMCVRCVPFFKEWNIFPPTTVVDMNQSNETSNLSALFSFGFQGWDYMVCECK